MIRGKGRGLVILLHGAPGVGKTATAEAVAAENQRPLFPITCGDLGFTPAPVDKSLRDIFRCAHLWNCILLLDEADVFLTTNRVGAIDEAFQSRVHLSLSYPHLSLEDAVAILKSNLGALAPAGTCQGQVLFGRYERYSKETVTKSADEDYFARHRSERAAQYDGPRSRLVSPRSQTERPLALRWGRGGKYAR